MSSSVLVADGNNSTTSERNRVLIFGAAGAIGKKLTKALTVKYGPGTVVAALRKTPLPESLTQNGAVVVEMGVNLRDAASVAAVVSKHASSLKAVWNLAAPLSVETEADPAAADDTVVGGMERILTAMDAANLPASVKLLFSDSIGSFGSSAPRELAPASWLVAHPEQDPGSAYGRQKRACRDLMAASKYDSRWAVIPGVLHDDPTWGDGTTEYALAMLKEYHIGAPFHCPVQPTSVLPMVHLDDLVLGLVALTDAPASVLQEPQAGYALAGFSFSPQDLQNYLKSLPPLGASSSSAFDVTYDENSNAALSGAALFAELWPNSLSGDAAARDLQWTPRLVPSLAAAVTRILAGHALRSKEGDGGV